MQIAYRREIDGLRAIAVLAVVLYHAGIGGAGYVGVDIFFVISGYLITSLLLKERDTTGRIDLLGFYARRVRRIFPAAIVVVLATLAASVLLLPHPEQVARSASAALLFVSNVYFQLHAGDYFGAAVDEMPLLHLWSLSVEEQFYLLWPALVFIARKRRVFLVFALASFALAEYWIAQGNAAAFYQMPARFWELAAGGIVAASPGKPMPKGTLHAGLAAILVACVVPIAHFPGIGALPAVIGSVLLIASLHGGASNAWLASTSMVAIGLVSYSLYLWHWPLLAIYRATGGESGAMRLALCVVALVLAAITWRYVERPFRNARFAGGRTVLAGTLSCVLLAGIAFGVRDEAQRDAPLALQAERDVPSRECLAMGVRDPFPKCASTAPTAIWGDSMAHTWAPAFPSARLYTRTSCAPYLGYMPNDFPADHACRDFNEQVIGSLDGVDALVLVALWRPDNLDSLAPTLERLRDVRRVIVIGPTPRMRQRVPKCIREQLACAVTRSEFDASAQPILTRLRTLAQPYPNVEVVDVTERFCNAADCPPILDGLPLYSDDHHLTKRAAVRALPSALGVSTVR